MIFETAVTSSLTFKVITVVQDNFLEMKKLTKL